MLDDSSQRFGECRDVAPQAAQLVQLLALDDLRRRGGSPDEQAKARHCVCDSRRSWWLFVLLARLLDFLLFLDLFLNAANCVEPIRVSAPCRFESIGPQPGQIIYASLDFLLRCFLRL